MNKSKFLKKSLAMILSVLMIVAMIPLGASAADVTDLTAIYIDGYSVTVSNKTFKADVSGSKVTVLVTGLNDGEIAEVTQADGSTTQVVSSEDDNELTLANFTNSGNVYTIPLTLINEDSTASYTIQLTKVAQRTTAELAKAEVLTMGLGASISGRNINVQVPLGYSDFGNKGTLKLTTKDGAKIDGETTKTIDGFADGDEVEVTSESGGRVALYTVRVTEVAVLEAFQAGDVAAKINNDDATITATYPASVLVKPDTEYNPPAKSMKTTFTAPAGTTVTLNGAGLTSGNSYDYLDPDAEGYAFKEDMELVVICKEVPYTYTVNFYTEADTQNSITAATVDGEAATITGTTIKANVQSNAGANGDVSYVLVAPVSATVKVTNNSGVETTLVGANNYDGTASFAGTAPIADLKKGLIIVVTSQAGKNKQYELVVTATGDVDTTELTSFGLLIGGTTYAGTVNKAARTVTVKVPYLTIDTALAGATVIATTNAYVKAAQDEAGTAITSAGDLGLTGFTLNSSGTTGTATGKIWAVAKNSETAPATEYSITVTLETAKSGNTLTSLVATSANHYKVLSSDNTYAGSIKTNADKSKTVTIKPAYSECQAGTDLYLKTLATANGGVAFKGDENGITVAMPAVLDSKKTTDLGTAFMNTGDSDVYVYVLPEIEARKEMAAAGTGNTAKGSAYAIDVVSQDPQTGTTFTNIKFDTTTLNSSLNGTVPYGMTVENEAAIKDDTTFFADDFSISKFATLWLLDESENVIGQVVKGGDTDGDGNANDASASNLKFGFVRNTDGTTTVYAWDGTSATVVAGVRVIAEDAKNKDSVAMGTVKYAQPNTEAKITAFSVAGTAGTIKSDGYNNWTITVTVPLGTKLTTLVPTFTASAGAVVKQGGETAKSGETMMDFTNPVVLVVTSEDGGKTNSYTVTVTAAEGFTDVPSNAWYYNNVMAAYNAGLVSGTGNGKFEPLANITRRDFAILVYKLLGSPTPESTTSFLDVAANDYAAAAIACLKEKDIVSGDGDTGNFRPAANISRQEAACIVANALNLAGTSETKFNDDAKIASWASAKVYACYAAGVLSGDKDTGNFRPTANITRAEAASIILNASSK